MRTGVFEHVRAHKFFTLVDPGGGAPRPNKPPRLAPGILAAVVARSRKLARCT